MYECRGRQAGIAPAILLHFRQPWRSDAASGLFEPLELMAHIPVRHPSGDDAELARATNCDSIAEVAPMSERAFWEASISARTMQLRLTCRNRARDPLRQ
jgi:hypothetical protein